MLTKTVRQSRSRPSILSHPKYRHKEEKRKLMKMTCKKLKKLEDPESVLCKAVLINNTLKYLQQNGGIGNSSQDYQPDLDIDILNREIQFPSPPLNDQNISSDNEFFNICSSSAELCLPDGDDVPLGDGDEEQSREDINNLREDRHNLSGEGVGVSSYQDQSSKVYNISSSSCTSSLCSNNSSQSILSVSLHRIVECKV